MRLKYDDTNDVYVAQKHSTSSAVDDSDVVDQQTNLVGKIGMKKNCVVMRRYYKLVFLISFAVCTLFIYLTFIRSPATQSLSKLPSSGEKAADKLGPKDNDDDLLKCEIYMESQCSDTTSFFETQLMPAWPKIKSFVDLQVVPYGKAKETPEGADDYAIRCQHGNTECLVNQMMVCGMKRMNFVTEHYLPYLKCLQGEQAPALRRCCERSKLILSDIETCANGKEGRQLHHDMGNLTRQLKPQLNFVPWIVINGKRSREAFGDFVGSLCKHYKKSPRPTVCA